MKNKIYACKKCKIIAMSLYGFKSNKDTETTMYHCPQCGTELHIVVTTTLKWID